MGVGFLSFEPQRIDQYAQIALKDQNQWSMGPQEAFFLASIISAMRAKTVVEIGTHLGHSALFMCHALRANQMPGAVFHTFEITERADEARETLGAFGFGDMAYVHKCSSQGAEAARIRDRLGPIDLMLIDGDHSFEGSYGDFLFWSRAVRPGGILLFHDISYEFEKTYLVNGLRSVYSTIKTIEAQHSDFSVLKLVPPNYHNITSLGIVQKAFSEEPAKNAANGNGAARSGKSAIASASPEVLQNRPWESIQLPAQPYPVTMLQLDELKYLYWLARDATDGPGAIVDIGSWMGGSTAAMAQGVLDRGAGKKPSMVHAFDRFVWDAYSKVFCPTVPLAPGDDMEVQFLRSIETWGHLVVAHKTELESATWNAADEIALLFIDAAGSQNSFKRIMNTFGPGLRPGSIVVFQDFKHWTTSFLPPLVLSLPYLKLVHMCKDGCSLGFEFTGPFVEYELPLQTPETVDDLYSKVCGLIEFDAPSQTSLRYTWVNQMLNQGQYDKARQEWERIKHLPVCAGCGDSPEAVGKRIMYS